MTLPNSIRLVHTPQRRSDTAQPCTCCGTPTQTLNTETGAPHCLSCQQDSLAAQIAEHLGRRSSR